ncbi:MAG: YceI family protein [Opitutaceae bacterium]|nr:YceI family protein [Verrucomicrobiales bacterium]
MTKTYLSIATLVGMTSVLVAAPINFDFKDPKGVNNATFKLDAPLEAITGSANGVSGQITFDPENPSSIKGRIIVAANTLHVGNPMMKEHLHGANWLDVAKHPEITFETVSVKNARTEGNVTNADVTGKLSIKGTTKEVTVPVKLTYLKDKLKDRFPTFSGDLLVLRANFVVKRSDFGIQPGQNEDKVANDIELSLSIAGMAPKK